MEHSCSCLIYHFSVSGCQRYQMKNSFSCFTLLLGVWITDNTHLLVFNISPSGWISDGTLLLVFDISLLGDWISDEALPPVFNISLRGLDSYSCLILLRCFSMSDKTHFLVVNISLRGLDIRWNTPTRVRYITSRCFDIRFKSPFHICI